MVAALDVARELPARTGNAARWPGSLRRFSRDPTTTSAAGERIGGRARLVGQQAIGLQLARWIRAVLRSGQATAALRPSARMREGLRLHRRGGSGCHGLF